MRILIVKNCMECPIKFSPNGYAFNGYGCRLTKRLVYRLGKKFYKGKFPEDCPLQEYKQITPLKMYKGVEQCD